MAEITFLTAPTVIYIHDCYIKQFGGSGGIRDLGLLESAIMAPQATFMGAYLHKDIFSMAAAYAYSIIKNHPFIDGNKRTGITTALVFMRYNNVEIFFKKNQLVEVAVAIAASNISEEKLTELFRNKGFL